VRQDIDKGENQFRFRGRGLEFGVGVGGKELLNFNIQTES